MTDTAALVDELVNALEAHTAVHEKLMDGFVFHEKSLAEWSEHFDLDIPDPMTPEQFRTACAKLARRIQKASYFYTECNSTLAAITSGGDNTKAKLITETVDAYAAKDAKRPAAAVLDQLATARMNNIINHALGARILRDYWRDRRDALIEIRKSLEAIGMSHNTELKYLHNE